MNSNVCILYIGIFCVPSIYDGIDNHRTTSIFFSADKYSSSCVSWGHGLSRYFPFVHTSCKIHSGTRRNTTVEYEDFSERVSKHCNHKPPTSTEELFSAVRKRFCPSAAGCSEMLCTIPGGVQNLTGQRPEQPGLVSQLALPQQEGELSMLRSLAAWFVRYPNEPSGNSFLVLCEGHLPGLFDSYSCRCG